MLALRDLAEGDLEAAEPPLRTQFATPHALVQLYQTWNWPDDAARYAHWLSQTSPDEGPSRLPTL